MSLRARGYDIEEEIQPGIVDNGVIRIIRSSNWVKVQDLKNAGQKGIVNGFVLAFNASPPEIVGKFEKTIGWLKRARTYEQAKGVVESDFAEITKNGCSGNKCPYLEIKKWNGEDVAPSGESQDKWMIKKGIANGEALLGQVVSRIKASSGKADDSSAELKPALKKKLTGVVDEPEDGKSTQKLATHGGESGVSSSARDMEVAKEILSQLGGRKFTSMTGAYSIMSGKNSLRMRLPKAKEGINFVEIKLNGKDLYDVEFGRIRKSNGLVGYKALHTFDNVYFDGLVGLFEKTTGLYIRM